MAGNSSIIATAFRDFEKHIIAQTESRLKDWCYELMVRAYRNRLGAHGSHEFTGNLINSIMVGLYKQGDPVFVCIVGDRGVVKAPIMGKMRMRPSQLGYEAKMYRFKQDWSGTVSAYVPTVQTDGGNGIEDAKRFFHSYKPSGKDMFNVVVAYPVEYANWVETERQTTGYLQTLQDAKTTGVTFMQLKAAA